MCKQNDFGILSLDAVHAGYVKDELSLWHRHYLPVKGTVLDIGAGCGETALFYLNHGADRVVSIESDPTALKHLYKNFGKDERVTILPYKIDSGKIDIDGGEKDWVIETHFPVRFHKLHRIDETRLWRIEKHGIAWMHQLHMARIKVAHEIRYVLDLIDDIIGDDLSDLPTR